MTKVIIGFAGKKGCGKSTAATHLCQKLGFVKHSFADPLKAMTYQFIKGFGYSDMDVDHYMRVDKEFPIPLIGRSARLIMQTLGTEWGRNCIRDDVWVRVERYRLISTKAQWIVYDDIRFENEAELIRDKGGVIIHIDRDDLVDPDHHASERGIINHDDDLFIDNDADDVKDFLFDLDLLIEQNISELSFAKKFSINQ